MQAHRRVFAASILHETNSFNRFRTTLDHFRRDHFMIDRDQMANELRGTNSAIGGFLAAAEACNWDFNPVLSAHTIPSGPVSRDAFEAMWEIIRSGLVDAIPIEGVALGFHGSMVVDGFPDAEGEYLRRVRDVVGGGVPIAISLDLHCNVTPAMVECADILTAYRTTPHIDIGETSTRAGLLLDRAMRGEIEPVLYLAQPATLVGVDHGRTITGHGPMVDILAQARALEESETGVLDVSVHAGFPWSDLAEAGPSIVVTADRRDPRFQAFADGLADMIWQSREYLSIEILPVDAAVKIAMDADDRPGPLLIGEYSDSPAGGTYGDATNLLRAMIEAKLENAVVAPLFDPETVDAAFAVGVGVVARFSLGGKCDPRFGGPPVEVEGRVAALSEAGSYLRKGPYQTGVVGHLGRSVRIDVGGVSVIVSSIPNQVDDREMFRMFGIEPETVRIIAAKSMNHFRADFEPMARRLIYTDGGGLASLHFEQFPYRLLRRPIWPVD